MRKGLLNAMNRTRRSFSRCTHGGTAPSPLDIPDLFAWYSKTDVYQDAARTIQATAQLDPVGGMTDLSGGGRHAAVNSPIHVSPVLQKDAFGGTDRAVYFNGVNSGLKVDWTGLHADELTLVMRIVPCSTLGRIYLSFNGIPTHSIGINNDFTVTPQWSSLQDLNVKLLSTPVPYNADSITLVYRIFPSGTPGCSLRKNGSTTALSFTPGAEVIDDLGIIGSCRQVTFEDNSGQFLLQDLMIYSRAISDVEAVFLESLLSTRPVPTTRFETGRPLLVFDGNSIPNGYGSSLPFASVPIIREIGGNCVNLAVAGLGSAQGSPNLTSGFSTRVTPYYHASRTDNIYILLELTNDIAHASAPTAATVFADIKTLTQTAVTAGFNKVAIMTCLPNATITSQGRESVRLAVNALLRDDFTGSTGQTRITTADGGITYATHLLDCGDDPDMGQTDDEDNTTYYVDGAHPTTAGHALLEERYIRPFAILCGIGRDAPTGLAVADQAAALVTWNAVAGVTKYQLRKSVSGLNTWTVFDGLTDNEYQDTITVTQDIDYQVMASDGYGDWSATVTVEYTRVVVEPDDIAGLTLWLEADGTLWQDSARTTLATADTHPVGAWDDQSGTSNHALQATSGKRPILKTGILNSLPVIRFDGSDDAFDHTGIVCANFTFFMVVKDTGDVALWGGTSGNPQLRHGESANTLATFDGSNNPISSTLAVAQSSFSLVAFTRTSSTVTFWQNGISYGTGTMTPSQTFNEIGTFGSGSNWLNGDVAEIVVYDSALSAGDRQDIENYLMNKYGLG